MKIAILPLICSIEIVIVLHSEVRYAQIHSPFWYVKVSKTVAVATILKTAFSSTVYALQKQVM